MYVARIFILEGKGQAQPFRDSVELINVVRHDLSQATAPFEYFFGSRLNCRIKSVIKTLSRQIYDTVAQVIQIF